MMKVVKLYDMQTEVPNIVTFRGKEYFSLPKVYYDNECAYYELKLFREEFTGKYISKRYLLKGNKNPLGGYRIPFWIIYKRME